MDGYKNDERRSNTIDEYMGADSPPWRTFKQQLGALTVSTDDKILVRGLFDDK